MGLRHVCAVSTVRASPTTCSRSSWWTTVLRHRRRRSWPVIRASACCTRASRVQAWRATPGWLHPRASILAFIDADCRAHPDWLHSLLQALRSSPPKTVLGGDVRIWDSGSGTLDAIAAYESVFAYRFKLYIEQHGYSGTGNLAMFRRDFEATGPFAGIDVAEDMEWGQRARAAGLRFRYVPEMIVFHPARSSLRELYTKWDRQITHYRNMAEGTPGWRLRWLAQALLVLASPIIGAVTVLTSDRIHGLVTRCKAIGVLCAVRIHRAMTMLALLRTGRTVIWNR